MGAVDSDAREGSWAGVDVEDSFGPAVVIGGELGGGMS